MVAVSTVTEVHWDRDDVCTSFTASAADITKLINYAKDHKSITLKDGACTQHHPVKCVESHGYKVCSSRWTAPANGSGIHDIIDLEAVQRMY